MTAPGKRGFGDSKETKRPSRSLLQRALSFTGKPYERARALFGRGAYRRARNGRRRSGRLPDRASGIRRRRRMSEARPGELMFRGLLETAPDAMIIVDGDGKIVLVHSQTERLVGHARQEIVGQPVETLVPERFRANHPAHRTGYFA